MSLVGCRHVTDFQRTNTRGKGGWRERNRMRDRFRERERTERGTVEILTVLEACKCMADKTFQLSGKQKTYLQSGDEIA